VRARLDAPVGTVVATLEANGEVTVQNVPSWRSHKSIEIRVEEKTVRGDIAWGGNWFFLVQEELTQIEALTERAWRIRQALNAQGHPDIDHVELFGPPKAAGASARSFVLCPGKAYDRSPCGTGTSAKLACLAADGKLAEGATWVQESIIGSTFSASYRWLDRTAGKVIPSIRGTAYVTAESTLLLDERDPFRWGIR
jgi:proline racemase